MNLKFPHKLQQKPLNHTPEGSPGNIKRNFYSHILFPTDLIYLFTQNTEYLQFFYIQDERKIHQM